MTRLTNQNQYSTEPCNKYIYVEVWKCLRHNYLQINSNYWLQSQTHGQYIHTHVCEVATGARQCFVLISSCLPIDPAADRPDHSIHTHTHTHANTRRAAYITADTPHLIMLLSAAAPLLKFILINFLYGSASSNHSLSLTSSLSLSLSLSLSQG